MKETYISNPYYLIARHEQTGDVIICFSAHEFDYVLYEGIWIALPYAAIEAVGENPASAYRDKIYVIGKDTAGFIKETVLAGFYTGVLDRFLYGYPTTIGEYNAASFDWCFGYGIPDAAQVMPFPYEFSDSATDVPIIVYPGAIPVDKVPGKVITDPDGTLPLELDKVLLPDGTIDNDYVGTIVGDMVLNPPKDDDIDRPLVYPWLPDITGLLKAIGALLEGILDGILSIPGILEKIWTWLSGLTLEGVLAGLAAIPRAIWGFFETLLSEMLAILLSILEFLAGFIDALVAALLYGLEKMFLFLFIPDMERIKEKLDALAGLINEKFPFINQIRDLLLLFAGIKDGSMKPFEFTYRGATVSLVDFGKFKSLIPFVHGIIIALAYFRFVRRLYRRVPSLIGGFSK